MQKNSQNLDNSTKINQKLKEQVALMREYQNSRQMLEDLKRKIQMTHRILVQRKQGDEELKSLRNEYEITLKLIETEKDKNRDIIHFNSIKI